MSPETLQEHFDRLAGRALLNANYTTEPEVQRLVKRLDNRTRKEVGKINLGTHCGYAEFARITGIRNRHGPSGEYLIFMSLMQL